MKVLILALKGFETIEFSSLFDVTGWARLEGGIDVEAVVCGFTPEVTSTFGLTVKTDLLIDDVDPSGYDALAIPGGFEEYGFYEEAYSEKTAELIKAFDDRNKPVASICVAALALGYSGILKGRKSTTYALGGGHRQRQLAGFGTQVLPDERVVVDGNVITSCGPGTAADVAFCLLQMLTDKESTEKVMTLMGFGV